MGYTHNRTHKLSSPSHPLPDTSRLPHLLLCLLFVSRSLLCLFFFWFFAAIPHTPLSSLFSLKPLYYSTITKYSEEQTAAPLTLVRTERLRELASRSCQVVQSGIPLVLPRPPNSETCLLMVFPVPDLGSCTWGRKK